MKKLMKRSAVFALLLAMGGHSAILSTLSGSENVDSQVYAQESVPTVEGTGYYCFEFCECNGCGSPSQPNRGGKCTGSGNCLSYVGTCS